VTKGPLVFADAWLTFIDFARNPDSFYPPRYKEDCSISFVVNQLNGVSGAITILCFDKGFLCQPGGYFAYATRWEDFAKALLRVQVGFPAPRLK